MLPPSVPCRRGACVPLHFPCTGEGWAPHSGLALLWVPPLSVVLLSSSHDLAEGPQSWCSSANGEELRAHTVWHHWPTPVVRSCCVGPVWLILTTLFGPGNPNIVPWPPSAGLRAGLSPFRVRFAKRAPAWLRAGFFLCTHLAALSWAIAPRRSPAIQQSYAQ